MEKRIILEKIHIALDTLISNDRYLFENDLSERCITHKLAEYLQPLFLGYNVDCEYNRNVSDIKNEKRINILKDELTKKMKEHLRINNDREQIIEKSVLPDIIIHKRGNGSENLCVFEAKKESCGDILNQYDEIKLEAYASNKYGNELRYDYGFFIEFKTGQLEQKAEIIKTFVNGNEENN